MVCKIPPTCLVDGKVCGIGLPAHSSETCSLLSNSSSIHAASFWWFLQRLLARLNIAGKTKDTNYWVIIESPRMKNTPRAMSVPPAGLSGPMAFPSSWCFGSIQQVGADTFWADAHIFGARHWPLECWERRARSKLWLLQWCLSKCYSSDSRNAYGTMARSRWRKWCSKHQICTRWRTHRLLSHSEASQFEVRDHNGNMVYIWHILPSHREDQWNGPLENQILGLWSIGFRLYRLLDGELLWEGRADGLLRGPRQKYSMHIQSGWAPTLGILPPCHRSNPQLLDLWAGQLRLQTYFRAPLFGGRILLKLWHKDLVKPSNCWAQRKWSGHSLLQRDLCRNRRECRRSTRRPK